MEATVPHKRSVQDWAALGGVLYVALFIVGNVLMFAGTVSGDDPPAKFMSYFGDSGHRNRIGFGWVLAGLGLFAFLWFVVALWRAVCDVDGNGFLATLTAIGGGIYAALALAGIGLDMAVRTMSDDTYRHEVYPGLIHAADDAGYVMHASGGAGLSAMIFAASLAFLRSGTVPRWLGWLGILAGIAALATIVFIPMIVWALWILAVSALLFARGTRAPADARVTVT